MFSRFEDEGTFLTYISMIIRNWYIDIYCVHINKWWCNENTYV